MLVFQRGFTSRFSWCLEYDRGYFWGWVLPETARDVTQLDLLFANKEELIKKIIISGSVGYNDHEVVKAETLRW